MPRTHEADDVICLVIPEGVDPFDEHAKMHLDQMAKDSVRAQWTMDNHPTRLEFGTIEWLITGDLEKVDEFQPAHDCAECREGNAKARQFLAENPGRMLAMANIHYTEVWPSWSKL